MPTPIFTWLPDIGASQSCKPTVLSSKYGDGYEQRTSLGINNHPKKWSVRFTGYGEKAVEILDFLKAQGGAESFVWTDPMNVTGTYICREWRSSQTKPNIYEVSGDFEEVFE